MPNVRCPSGALLLSALCLIAACGGDARAPAAAPEAPGQMSPASKSMDADGDLSELDRAEAELDRVFGGDKKTPGRKEEAGEATPLSGGTEDSCGTACRALASMQRAAAHLCELAGDGDARCDGAKQRVAKADERVRGSCPTCPG